MGHSHNIKIPPGGVGGGDYSQFGDDVHENDALFIQAMWDTYQMWKVHGRIITDLYTIKYAAGISHDGLYYFRDNRLDSVMTFGKRDLEYDFLWFTHELIEREMAQGIGEKKEIILTAAGVLNPGSNDDKVDMGRIHYRAAHQLAEVVENRIAVILGFDLDAYTKKCDQFIKYCDSRPLILSPASLDLYPYYDEMDLDTLDEIVKSGGPICDLILPRGVSSAQSGKPTNE
jgi:hypothetical protein